MEVHHHSHTSTGSGHRRKWTHYFWEFLMLFLAVLCGFFAENFREHKVEDLRAKEFARALVQDLKNDTAAINYFKKAAKHYVSICDTLLLLNKTRLEGPNASKFSYYTRFTYWTSRIAWNRTTFEQIRNSGSLRYFKHGLLSKLMKYDALINDIEREAYNREIRGNDLLSSINRIMEPQLHHDVSKFFIFYLDTISKQTINSFLSRNVPSLEPRRYEINEMLNMIVVQQRNLRFGEEKLREAEVRARELITEFTAVYNLK